MKCIKYNITVCKDIKLPRKIKKKCKSEINRLLKNMPS